MALALSQHGLVSRAQAHAPGLSDSTIRRRVESGRWRRVRKGVYAIGAPPPTWEQRMMGLCLAAGDGAVVSHRSAARLWGVVGAAGRPELTVPTPRRARLPGATVHQSARFDVADLAIRSSLPVTSPARTLVDASAHQPDRTVGRWIDEAVRAGTLDLQDLRRCVARLAGPGRRHLAPIRAELAQRLPGYDPGDSELEVQAIRWLVRGDVGMPVQQHPVRLPDGRVVELDLAYPPPLVAIELDGWAFHGDRTSFHADRDRRNQLTMLGWQVPQFTARTTEQELLATVRPLIEARPHRR